MGKLDKTKENLKVNRLGKDDRKELFDRFVDAGGQIIDDEGELIKKKKRAVYDREKQLAYKKLIEARKQRAAQAAKGRTAREKTPSRVSQPGQFSPGAMELFFQRFLIRMRLFLMRVCDFSSRYFNNKFLHEFNTVYMPSMNHIQMLFYEIFKQNPEAGYEVISDINNINSIYYELAKRMSDLYDVKSLMEIIQSYLASPENRHRVSNVKEPILRLFKNLYILKAYQESILSSFEKSLSSYTGLTKKKSSYYSQKRRDLKNDLGNIFDKLFYILYWLFCGFRGSIIPIGSPAIDEILGITMEDRPGVKKKKEGASTADMLETDINIEKSEDKKEEKEKNEENDEKSEDKDVMTDDIKKGFQLMRHFTKKNIKKLREIHDESKKFTKINDNDKILMTYLLMQEFDREYSFLLTTNKIKYSSEYSRKGDMNYRDKLLILANDIKKCFSTLFDYTTAAELYFNTKNEKPLSNDQYIEYNKKLGNLSKKREQAGSTAKMTVYSFMDNLIKLLRPLIDDMRGSRKIIDNPGDEIAFDVTVESNRKLNNKTIYEAICYAFFYASAFVYRLGAKGDLAGGLEFDDKETNGLPERSDSKNDVQVPEEKADPAVEKTDDYVASPSVDKLEDTGDAKSIIDELDDFV